MTINPQAEYVGYSIIERIAKTYFIVGALPTLCFVNLLATFLMENTSIVRPRHSFDLDSAPIIFIGVCMYMMFTFFHCLHREFFGFCYQIDAKGVALNAPSGFAQYGCWEELESVNDARNQNMLLLRFKNGNTVKVPYFDVPFQRVIRAFSRHSDNPLILELYEKCRRKDIRIGPFVLRGENRRSSE